MSEFSDLPFDHFTPGPMVEEGFTARAGQPLPDGSAVASTDTVVEAISTVYDPEIPVNIYELGLIYELDIDAKDGSVLILMTLTAPGCGMGPAIAEDAKSKILLVPGVDEAEVNITWEPAWNQSMISEEGKMKLGLI